VSSGGIAADIRDGCILSELRMASQKNEMNETTISVQTNLAEEGQTAGSRIFKERRSQPRRQQICRILGINFFTGNAQQAVDQMRGGGLLVVPAAPALKDLPVNTAYREALLGADMVIPDSGFMVLIWNLMRFRLDLRRLSGLEYLRLLLKQSDVRAPGNTLWVMASPRSSTLNLKWLVDKGVRVRQDSVYIAPMYGSPLNDPALLELMEIQRPEHVIVTVGGGTQERLGFYLKQNLTYAPAIHCIGAAIAFLSGDQVHIPEWADTFYLGWLLRCIAEPMRYVPRYWRARKLLGLMLKHRGELPPLETGTETHSG